MKYVLGVDGGGSKTYAVVVNENGEKLGSGLAGTGNHQGPGIEEALKNISASMTQALEIAGLSVDDINFVQYGLAGADHQVDFDILRPALATLPYQNWDVVCDTYEGLRTGSKDNTGVVLVCGSGTNAAGRNKLGQTIQTGGMGYLFGDAAGGGFLASETFRAAIRSWEQREIPSVLTNLVPISLGFETMQQMYAHFLDNQIYHVSNKLAVTVHKAADQGDLLAIKLLEKMGKELGLAAASVIKRLGHFEEGPVPIVLVGSVLQKGRSPYVLQRITEEVEAAGYQPELIIPNMAPVYGSIMLAFDHLGLEVTEEMYSKFENYGGYDE